MCFHAEWLVQQAMMIFAQTSTTAPELMKGKYSFISSRCQEDVGCVRHVQLLEQLLRRNLRRLLELLPVQVEGRGLQCRRCCYTGAVVQLTVASVPDVQKTAMDGRCRMLCSSTGAIRGCDGMSF